MEVLIPLLLAIFNVMPCHINNVPFDDIEEISGAVWFDGAIHVHDDDNPFIYRLEYGRITNTYQFRDDVYDLEDIAVSGDLIYLADTGRNGGGDSTYKIYVVQNMKQIAQVEFELPELYDIEAMFIRNNEIYLITKGRYSEVFMIDSHPSQPEYMGRLLKPNGDYLRSVTGADILDNGRFLVRNYDSAYIYDLNSLKPIKELVTVFEVQGESIAVTPYGYFTVSEHSTHYSEYRGCLN